MKKKIALAIIEHSLWGFIFQPYIVIEERSGGLNILEIATDLSTQDIEMNDLTKRILAFSLSYSERSLMKNFSKEKTLKSFLSNVTTDTINRYIRPCIDGYQRKIIQILHSSEMPLYLRPDIKSRTLWMQDRIEVTQKPSQAVFTFKKDTESGLHYFIHIEGESGVVELYSKSCAILSHEPAAIITERVLLFFEDIDVKKLTPFFTKKVITVPSSSENQYLKTFVRTCLLKFKVNSIGVNIKEIQPNKEAHISLESDWHGNPTLLMSLYYEKKKYPLDYPNKKIVIVDEKEEESALRWFYPDKRWENEQIKLLLDNGLYQTGPSHFSCNDAKDVDLSGNFSGMVEWIRMHKHVLEAFKFSQNLFNHSYYLGEISMETNLESGRDWFDLHCIVVFGDYRIPFSRFRNHILHNKREYTLPDGSIAILPAEWFDRYYELMLFSKNSKDAFRLNRSQYKLTEPFNEISSKISLLIDNQDLPDVPSTLNAELRPYQVSGFQWLVWLYKNGFGGCLADDMGLGKTVQTIAFLEYIYSQESFEHLPSLIVMPTSLLYNWQNEIRKFAPELTFYAYSGSKRLKSEEPGTLFSHYQLILTTYGTLRNDIDLLKKCRFHHLIMDESQYVKNPDSLTYKAVREIDALFKIALTGTPLENSLTDLWAQFNLVNENMLGSYNGFRNAYINPIAQENRDKEEALLRLIKPFLLRRTKQEVTPELPLLLEETVYCDMTQQQKEFYHIEKNKLRNSLMDEKVLAQPNYLSILTLQGLTRLRLLANHPILIEPDYVGDSGKFEQIIMRFETLRSEGHKVLIFSSFVKHLRILANHFDNELWPYAWLTGSISSAERDKEIVRFTNDPEISCFFISLKAGGVGLNLTAADYVFIIDPWWNPASEMQALSRSHRIGQDKNVIVYRFISTKTIEDKIRLLQEEKSRLAATFVTSGNPLANLDREELSRLL